jgi:4-hydroxybenzoate polyprenyltransferase
MASLNALETPVSIASDAERPLCVDLDGTLVKSDTLVDSLAVLARHDLSALLHVPGWLLNGKAHLKSQVTSRVSLDVNHLPYNQTLLTYLEEEYAAGRKLYLATGADSALAHRIAAHLPIFEDVLASDGKTNLTGHDKLQQLEHRFASTGFDYIGNAIPDLPLLKSAQRAMVANPDLGLSFGLKVQKIQVSRRFDDRPNWVAAVARAIRVHQWAKNVLVFLPLLLAHALKRNLIAASVAAFACFCLTASATYILNDLLDIEADRAHHKKRLRAFASGNLSIQAGLAIMVVFLALSFSIAYFLPRAFLTYLGLYLITTVAYSFALKRIVLLDVVVLSSLYTIRMLAGAAATSTPISPWLSAFAIFLFLSLAMVKRFSELQNLNTRGLTPANGRGYLLVDIEQLRSFGTASAYASIVVFAMYISGKDVTALYHHPARMWLITPLMILWLSRIWLLAGRGILNEDPVVFALTDRMSLLMGLGVLLIAFAAL